MGGLLHLVQRGGDRVEPQPAQGPHCCTKRNSHPINGVNDEGSWIYIAPQGAQVRITQCYLQIALYLPLPRKHSPDGAYPRLRLRTSNCSLLLIYLPRKDERLSRPGWLT